MPSVPFYGPSDPADPAGLRPADNGPHTASWPAAFGLTLTLVWIYLEVLRRTRPDQRSDQRSNLGRGGHVGRGQRHPRLLRRPRPGPQDPGLLRRGPPPT
ncbi:Bax inhibitor-1/YccA family protein [Streptomyces sviceus]|uniref:Bax inhibitor-1/YccA family membrane protein n=1 Tax=Streptomyces sviceus TaxID=285530 RepID=UPI0036A21977